MSLSYDPFTDPPPVSAFDADLYDASRGELDDVLRLWLSSIKRNYRRSISGRSTLHDVLDPVPRGRRRAP
ncbi:MAG: hypothetical protein Q7J04_02565 [Microcella sp.]|nr:hypothetical protein [Microcella sp.]